ncbi:hypothetical protein PQG02_31730 (plasmid) [Nostoc sp. UHCC 0926]|uniref:hypothetical protein n=1 Tax=Nostoc sp. UHCC 0926 TaxID=3025190 RepID=UPI0023615154|nr:hypothetical protein [Nostoc sp. UHCC 0926]WDD35978.1 hypothetical protein PQG02_31730 [Nostoc sp. UHCC 0926]
MKQPCLDCPFQKSVEYSLSPKKARDILQAIIHDKAFHCYKTVDYSKSIEGRITSESKLCFGAVLFLENTVRGGCRSNVMFRFRLMRQEFKLDDLRKEKRIYKSFDEFIAGASINGLKAKLL